MEIPVIPNDFMPEGTITCGPETSKRLKAHHDAQAREIERLTVELSNRCKPAIADHCSMSELTLRAERLEKALEIACQELERKNRHNSQETCESASVRALEAIKAVLAAEKGEARCTCRK